MINKYQDTIIKDSEGRIVYEERSDGFVEKSTYTDGQLARQETRYPNGITEIDHYAVH